MPTKETIADGVELWLGDCREILPTLDKVDAVVTDPPYGLGDKWQGGDGGPGWVPKVKYDMPSQSTGNMTGWKLNKS